MNIEEISKNNDIWLVGTCSANRPVDLQHCLFKGCANFSTRKFKKIPKENLFCDSDRARLIIKLVKTLKGRESASPITIGAIASSVKRWIKWSEENNVLLKEDTAVESLTKYRDVCKRIVEWRSLEILLLESINVTDSDRATLDPTENQRKNNDVWLIQTGKHSPGIRNLDFLRFLNPGDYSKPIHEWRKIRPRRLKEADTSSARSKFVMAIRNEFKYQHVSGTPSKSLSTYWSYISSWFRWSEQHDQPIDQDSAIEALIEYSHNLTMAYKLGTLNSKTVIGKLGVLSRIVASTMGLESYQVRNLLTMPPYEEPESSANQINQKQLLDFCCLLHDLIEHISSSLITTETIKPISLKAGPYSTKLPAQPEAFKNSDLPLVIRNRFNTHLRIWAEILRFMALTGANYQVVRELYIDDWTNSNRQKIIGYKNRGNKNIELEITPLYRQHLDRHIQFLEEALPILPTPNSPLFPVVHHSANSYHSILNQWRSGKLQLSLIPFHKEVMRACNKWVECQRVDRLTSRQLRKAKAQWLLRRYKGDSLAVSRSLGNTPQTTFTNYGGKGNLIVAQYEWGEFWKQWPNMQASIAPGFCQSPGNFMQAGENQTISFKECSDAAACLSCKNYCGEESLDYIHRILSLEAALKNRQRANKPVAEHINKIEQIVASFYERHPQLHAEITKLRQSIKNGTNPHPRFSALIQIQEALGNV